MHFLVSSIDSISSVCRSLRVITPRIASRKDDFTSLHEEHLVNEATVRVDGFLESQTSHLRRNAGHGRRQTHNWYQS